MIALIVLVICSLVVIAGLYKTQQWQKSWKQKQTSLEHRFWQQCLPVRKVKEIYSGT